eukprot:TRINITY_DN850_c0_g1_i3.p1 TRINITY_DN850_c0_g1~~TRINITY_DN850_c0_g1_i3.p1  ORF type:complete len:445 (+),score=76.45 TRINITY_DN850_c0_g1_i3:55-1389(+)
MTAPHASKPGLLLFAASFLFPICNYLAQGIFWPFAPLLFRLENACSSHEMKEQISPEMIDVVWTSATLISRLTRWLVTPWVIYQITTRFPRSLPQVHASFFLISALVRMALSCDGRNLLLKIFGIPAVLDPAMNLYTTLAVYSVSCLVDIVPSILTEQVLWRSKVIPFGITRGLGALVYGGAGAVSAWLDGPFERVFVHAGITTLTAALVLIIGSNEDENKGDKEKGHQDKHQHGSHDAVEKHAGKDNEEGVVASTANAKKPLWLEHFPFLLIMFIINIFAQALPGYSMILLRTINTPQHIISASIALACASEVPVFYFSKRLLEKYGVRNVLSVTTFSYFVRFVGYGYSRSYSPEYILIFKMLHGLTFATALSATLQYTDDYVPKESNIYFNALARSLTHAMGGKRSSYQPKQYFLSFSRGGSRRPPHPSFKLFHSTSYGVCF